MAVEFIIMERGEPGVAGGGTRKFYAAAQSRGNQGIKELTERIEEMSTVSSADIAAVLQAIVSIVPKILKEGYIVEIGDLGSFRISLSSEGSDTYDEVTAENIRKGKVIFRPGEAFRDMLQTLKYKKA